MYGVGFLFLLESPRTINRIFLLRFINWCIVAPIRFSDDISSFWQYFYFNRLNECFHHVFMKASHRTERTTANK